MKRGITVLVSVGALFTVGYFTAVKWAIRNETLTFYDASRDNRPVAVDIAVRRDKEMQANAGMIELPVAVLNHGNTVKFTEYSFLANVFAARGYLSISIQHDLPTDPPMVTKVGELYVGRQPQYLRGVANIKFALEEMKKAQPNADYDHLTVVGHSAGADISMYFARLHPELVKKVVALDNLRVPFVTSGKFKILSFRSKDPQSRPIPASFREKSSATRRGLRLCKPPTGITTCVIRDRRRRRPRSRLCSTSSSSKPRARLRRSSPALPTLSNPAQSRLTSQSHPSRTDAGITRLRSKHAVQSH